MITKILRVKNFGVFKDFAWKKDLESFKKKNIFYAYNGGGKTTLSNIFRMFSALESPDQKTELFDELRTNEESELEIEVDDKKKQFKPDSSAANIYVFNCDFVTEHVYEGTTSKLKKFSGKVKSNLKDKEINDLEKQIADKELELSKANSEIEKLEERFGAIKSQVSSDFGKKIANKRLTGLDIDSLPVSTKSADELNKEIDATVSQYHLSLQLDQLRADLDTLRTLQLESIDISVGVVEELLSLNVSATSSDRLKRQISNFKQHPEEEVSHGVESWFRKAKVLLQLETREHPAHCPLCASNIALSIDLLLAEYNAYFNQEYEVFVNSLSQAIQHVPDLVNRVSANNGKISTLQQLLTRYTSSAQPGLANFDSSPLTNSLLVLQNLYERKKADVGLDLRSQFDVNAFDATLKDYHSWLKSCEQAKQQLKVELEMQKLDPKVLEARVKELHKQLAYVLFNDDGKNTGQVQKYMLLKKTIETTTNLVGSLNTNLIKARARLKNEAMHVNRFLQELGIHHFTIDVHETKPSENIEIIYETGARKTRFKHSISDGEKTALSFAYFLSKIKYEVLDNEDVKLQETIILLDDPVSSLDENRLYSTAWIINSCLGNAKQLFVLSHNLVFLKFMGNVIGHKDRMDYFLNNHKGELVLEKLPYGLSNYTTIYFQKLDDIIQFNDGKLDYREARNFIPNNIRIVLESFLSFKLCALKNGSSAEGNRVAGLDKLVGRLKGNIGVYKTFKAAGGIDAKNIVDTLLKIQRITDPQAHGSPQSINEFNFISESELKELAENTLNIIKFLDSIHYDSVDKAA